MREMQVLDKGVGRVTSKKTANCGNEALKMKLLGALHATPSDSKHTAGLLNHEEKTTCKENGVYQRGEAARYRNNSGPTQTDLESLDQTKSRPVMLSSRKQTLTKTETKSQHQFTTGKKLVAVSMSDCKQKLKEKNMFAFDHEEGKEGSIEWATRGHSSRSNSKKTEEKKFTIEPRRIYFPRQVDSNMSLPVNGREKILPPPKKAPLQRREKDGSGETNKSWDREYRPFMEEKEPGKHFSQSPMEKQGLKSFEEDDFMSKGLGKANKGLSDDSSSNKSSSTLRQSKRVRIQKDVKTIKFNLPSQSPIGAEETVGSHEASEPHLASRSFSQMASVLEGFNTKLMSHKSKKSSEILSSALDKMHLQLQALESKIHADVGKLANIGKSKRKYVESTFQEQHERLRMLHDKFKEEVSQQLLDCRTTLEELDAYQLELKGTSERQKASHKKLLMQAEEAVKVQISDANTCIDVVNKEARHKMNGLKQALEEWVESEEVC